LFKSTHVKESRAADNYLSKRSPIARGKHGCGAGYSIYEPGTPLDRHKNTLKHIICECIETIGVEVNISAVSDVVFVLDC
jgi:hypothetical protein